MIRPSKEVLQLCLDFILKADFLKVLTALEEEDVHSFDVRDVLVGPTRTRK